MNKRTAADEEAMEAIKYKVSGGGRQRGFQMGPRYWPPVDDTTVLSLDPTDRIHGHGSALLERSDFADLMDYLLSKGAISRYPSAVFELAGPQSTLRVAKLQSGSFHFTTFWNSTPGHIEASFTMLSDEAAELAAWMADREAEGWEGWRSGSNKLTSAPPSKADWAMEITVDRGTGYLADGEDTLYYRGVPLEGWDTWDTMAKAVAGNDDLIEWKVTPVQQGRYHGDKQYPMFWKSELARQG